MAVAMPGFSTLKANIVTALREVAAAENAVSPARNFIVTQDRWRPWIENQQSVALVNVMVDNVSSAGGGSHFNATDRVNVNVDMYVLGTYDEQVSAGSGTITLTPADEIAAARLDLLIAQVRHAVSRMKNSDLGFSAGVISRNISPTITVYSQEGDDATNQYAPARLSLSVDMAYEPADDATATTITALNLTWKDTLESWASRYTYTITP